MSEGLVAVPPPKFVESAKAPDPKRGRTSSSTSKTHHDPIVGRTPLKKVAKGGAGGKGSWGKPGLDDLKGVASLDKGDPNFEEDDEGAFDDRFAADNLDLLPQCPASLAEAVDEYHTSAVVSGIVDAIEEHESVQEVRAIVLATAIEKAIERHNAQRELTSNLIAELFMQQCVSTGHLVRAFQSLLGQLDELQLDNPNASEMLAKFLARAIADDCLAPKAVTEIKAAAATDSQHAVSSALEQLVKRKHALVRLDTVWGIAGGLKPVRLLRKRILLLLREYISSCDADEATRCLRDLDVPHFHHEVVYEGILMALDQGDRTASAIIALFDHFATEGTLSSDQLSAGFERVFDSIGEISLDVPKAASLLTDLCRRAVAASVIAPEVAAKCPSAPRGRKRYVSEGDGGCVKT